jgi:hypothetical protein
MPRKPKREGGPTPQAPQHAAVQPPGALDSPNQPLASVPTGLPQGEHQALEQSMSAVPVPNMDARIQQAIAAVNGQQQQQQPVLGGGAILSQPTAYPSQPVQDGLPIGPGRGPDAVPAPAPPAQIQDYQMARYLPALEMLADQPNASYATRNWVRLLRGQTPPNITMESVLSPTQQPPQGGAQGGVPQ